MNNRCITCDKNHQCHVNLSAQEKYIFYKMWSSNPTGRTDNIDNVYIVYCTIIIIIISE